MVPSNWLLIESDCALAFSQPQLDADNAELICQPLLDVLQAQVLESQQDADMMTWLIDFEGTRLMLKAAHYTQSVWLEPLESDGDEVIAFLRRWWIRHPPL
ncbi:hypothetical protein BZG80_10520 [Salinivibrio sp. MA440]|uniref:DUF3630 family protein n=1 Tax=Salinivibrio sp. MA440 TaxID=1909456 RepID=UPI000988A0C6|nr:DUF3630 family protein [Salinivibrio sp. MA440]OOF03306.1 hypothetical protein BZG80_10520 [Salinivibrio sp. MA440]